MSFEKIILPDFIIAAMFKSSLAEINTAAVNKQVLKEEVTKDNDLTETGVKRTDDVAIPSLGGNNRNIIVIVNQPDTKHIHTTDLTFLTNVLKACALEASDFAVINVASQNFTYTSINKQLNAVKMILFDVSPSALKLPFTIPHFQPQNFSGVTYLLAPALAEINKPEQQGKQLKTALWTSLKKIFDIK